MSIPAKMVLGSSCVFTLGIIGYVHYKQYLDRNQLHEGVLLDVERRQRRKQENLYVLQQQLDIAKEIRKSEQNTNIENVAVTQNIIY